MDNIKKIDLNLLVTLDALLTHLNVTRAAAALNLSQPSVSVQLARLRTLFGDPLLMPAPRGMRATARADALREPLRQALESVARAVAPVTPFDPATASLTWRLAATDYSESTIVLPALMALRQRAPGSQLAVLALDPAQLVRQAEQGELDLAFHTTEGSPAVLRRRTLFTERYVLAGRRGHPRLKRRPTLAQFCRLDHAIVSDRGGGFAGPTDQALAQAGVSRRVVLSVPHFLFLRSVLAATDLVAMIPQRLADVAQDLQVVEAPVDVPGYQMSMLWHERLHRDPGHRWLREFIAGSIGGNRQ